MPAAGGDKSPAAAVYRQVSQAFPNAPSAQVARQRLSELTNRKDG
jgi:TolA-binding protein